MTLEEAKKAGYLIASKADDAVRMQYWEWCAKEGLAYIVVELHGPKKASVQVDLPKGTMHFSEEGQARLQEIILPKGYRLTASNLRGVGSSSAVAGNLSHSVAEDIANEIAAIVHECYQ